MLQVHTGMVWKNNCIIVLCITFVYNDKTQSRNSYFNFCYQFIFSSLNCYYNNYYIEDLYIYLIIHVHEPSYNQNDTDVELTYIQLNNAFFVFGSASNVPHFNLCNNERRNRGPCRTPEVSGIHCSLSKYGDSIHDHI